MPMNDEWTPTTGKVKTADLGLSEGEDWKIAHTMERQDSEMRRVIRSVAQEEDVETLEVVRRELEGILRQLDAVINNRAPEPDSPLTEIIRRVEALESWAYRNGARM